MAIIRNVTAAVQTPVAPVREVSFKDMLDERGAFDIALQDETNAEVPELNDLLQIIKNNNGFQQSGRGRSASNKGKTVIRTKALPKQLLADELDALIQALLLTRKDLEAEGIATEFRQGEPLNATMRQILNQAPQARVAAAAQQATRVAPRAEQVAPTRLSSAPVQSPRSVMREDVLTDEGTAFDDLVQE